MFLGTRKNCLNDTKTTILIKGHNFVESQRIFPIYNRKPLIPNINVYAKFEENPSKIIRFSDRNGRMDTGMKNGLM